MQTDKTDSLWETGFVGRGLHFSCENGKNLVVTQANRDRMQTNIRNTHGTASQLYQILTSCHILLEIIF